MIPDSVDFVSLPLSPQLQTNLAKLKFVKATPIQNACIVSAIEGKDIIGIAQTGTGKTLAFGLPLLQRLIEGKGKGLVVVPTRELALQVEESIRRVSNSLSIRFAVLIGGASMGAQKHQLAAKPQIIVATPGRLIDHLKQRTVSLSDVTTLILDEADRMFDMGFAPQVEEIMRALPEDRQTMLFSATMPDGISQMVKRYMRLPVRIEIAPQGSLADRLEQEVFVVRVGVKSQLLEKLLTDYSGTVLIFTRTKHGAKRIAKLVKVMGHPSAELHSNKSLAQRKHALQGFKDGRYRVLVATDIAARGIDVNDIELVINYDLPENPEDYVHRIGRTGRAGKAGKAISFASPDQVWQLKKIERLTRSRLQQSAVPSQLPEVRVVEKSFDDDDAPRGRFSRGGSDRSGGRGGRPGRSGGFERRSSFGGDRGSSRGSNEWKPASASNEWKPNSATAPVASNEWTAPGAESSRPRRADRSERPFASRSSGFSSSRSGSSYSRDDRAEPSNESSGRSSFGGSDRAPRRPFAGGRSGGFGARSGGYNSRSNEGGERRSFGDRAPRTGGYGARSSEGGSGERRSFGDRGPSRGGFGDRSSRGPRSGGFGGRGRGTGTSTYFSSDKPRSGDDRGPRKPFRAERRGSKRPGNGE